MRPDEYARLDGIGLAELVRAGEVTQAESAAAMAAAVDRVDSSVNAVVELYADVFELAHSAGTPATGIFAGVPFLRKDLHDEAGRLCELGSRFAEGRRARTSSLVIERFKSAGLQILGRSTVPELGLSSTTESAAHGATRNPWDLDSMAGGSSGGAAAAVASGIVPLADASDGGGSIRIPASCCGLVGLKPSRGRISMAPSRDEWGFGMATNLVVSRTVRDSASALDVLAGPAPGDPFEINPSPASFRSLMDQPASSLRIAFTTHPWNPAAQVDPEIVAAVITTAHVLEDLGHQLAEAQVSYPATAAMAATRDIFALHVAETIQSLAREMGATPSPETVEPVVWDAHVRGRELSGLDVLGALETRNRVARAFGSFFTTSDLLLCPTLGRLPPPIGELSTARGDIGFDDYWELIETVHPHVAVFNLIGLPAISLPVALAASGSPIGIQLIGPFGTEARLLRIAAQLEEAMPWRDRHPRIWAGSSGS